MVSGNEWRLPGHLGSMSGESCEYGREENKPLRPVTLRMSLGCLKSVLENSEGGTGRPIAVVSDGNRRAAALRNWKLLILKRSRGEISPQAPAQKSKSENENEKTARNAAAWELGRWLVLRMLEPAKVTGEAVPPKLNYLPSNSLTTGPETRKQDSAKLDALSALGSNCGASLTAGLTNDTDVHESP